MVLAFVAGMTFTFVVGWIIGSAMNTSKKHDEGRLCVYNSKSRGKILCKLAQPHYSDQRRVMVDTVEDSNTKRHNLPFFASADEVLFYTLDGEVVNEANWNKD
jgi:hypothetical protein